jgi:hypothetical protein
MGNSPAGAGWYPRRARLNNAEDDDSHACHLH